MGASNEEVAQVRARLGLDEPLPVQYERWAWAAVHGDFGESILVGRRPAFSLITERLPYTILLAVTGLGLAILVAVPLGVVAAVQRGRVLDGLVTSIVMAGQAMPSFWFGIILIILFGVVWRLLPPSGFTSWSGLILPAMTLAISQAPPIMRLVRSGMCEALNQPYVRTARSKGLAERVVIFRQTLPNAAIPVATVISLRMAELLGGSVIVEVVFGWPGLGQLLASSISQADFPVIQAGVLLIAVIVVVFNLISDVFLAILDPRVRLNASS
jgi:peptide/nickel transport system permease protein